jgi:hypothetical protein
MLSQPATTITAAVRPRQTLKQFRITAKLNAIKGPVGKLPANKASPACGDRSPTHHDENMPDRRLGQLVPPANDPQKRHTSPKVAAPPNRLVVSGLAKFRTPNATPLICIDD